MNKTANHEANKQHLEDSCYIRLSSRQCSKLREEILGPWKASLWLLEFEFNCGPASWMAKVSAHHRLSLPIPANGNTGTSIQFCKSVSALMCVCARNSWALPGTANMRGKASSSSSSSIKIFTECRISTWVRELNPY